MIEHIEHMGKDCGYIQGNKFHTIRDPKKHLFQKWKAFGVSREVLIRCVKKGVDTVVIHTNSQRLEFHIDEFLSSSLWWDYDEADRQMFVSLDCDINNKYK